MAEAGEIKVKVGVDDKSFREALDALDKLRDMTKPKRDKHALRDLAITLLLTVPLSLLRAASLSLIWQWFFVEQFGLPQLSLVMWVGVSILVGFFTSHTRKYDDPTDPIWYDIAASILSSIVPLGIAYLWHFFL
jgi:hypothetical protein